MSTNNITPSTPTASGTTAAPSPSSTPTPLPGTGPTPESKPDKAVKSEKPKSKKDELNKQLEEMLANMLKMVFRQQEPEAQEGDIEAKARAQAKGMVPSSSPEGDNASDSSPDDQAPSPQHTPQPNQMAMVPTPQPDNALEQQLDAMTKQLDEMAKKADALKAEELKAENQDMNKINGYGDLADTLRNIKGNIEQVGLEHSRNDPHDATNYKNLMHNLKELGENPMLKKVNSGSDNLERVGETVANQAENVIREGATPKFSMGGGNSAK